MTETDFHPGQEFELVIPECPIHSERKIIYKIVSISSVTNEVACKIVRSNYPQRLVKYKFDRVGAIHYFQSAFVLSQIPLHTGK